MSKEPSSFVSLLLENARTDLYRRNAFRVLNLEARATASDIKRHLRKMELERNFGEQSSVTEKAENGLLHSLLPDAAMITEAKSRLEDVETRFIDEFFALWAGRDAQATDQQPSIHDRATMFHAQALDIELSASRLTTAEFTDGLKQQRDYYWHEAIRAWQSVLKDEQVWHRLSLRVNEISDPRITKEKLRELRESLPLALLMINARLAVQASQRKATTESQRHISLMQEFAFDSEVVADAARRAAQPLCNRINDLCKAVEREARSAPERADQSIEHLLERTRPLLMAVDDLLPKDDPQRAVAFEAVAFAVNETIIAKSKAMPRALTRDWEAVQQQFERLARYASTPPIRRMVDQNIAWAKNNVQQSINTTCWFCGKRESQTRAARVVTLYQQQTQNHYYYHDVWVPRCPDCQAVHDRTFNLSWRGGAVGVVVGIILCVGFIVRFGEQLGAFIEGDKQNAFYRLLILLALAIIIIFGIYSLGKSIVYDRVWAKVPEGIEPADHSLNFPTVKELQDKGWTTNKPANT